MLDATFVTVDDILQLMPHIYSLEESQLLITGPGNVNGNKVFR